MTEEWNLVKTSFEFERALLEEFELYCKENHLDFDETVRKMIDALPSLSLHIGATNGLAT